MPLLRYQNPSLVRQTSSASILAPLVRRIDTGPLFASPAPVETGFALTASRVARGCDEGAVFKLGEERVLSAGEACGEGVGVAVDVSRGPTDGVAEGCPEL
jgi:hypothetical protein